MIADDTGIAVVRDHGRLAGEAQHVLRALDQAARALNQAASVRVLEQAGSVRALEQAAGMRRPNLKACIAQFAGSGCEVLTNWLSTSVILRGASMLKGEARAQ